MPIERAATARAAEVIDHLGPDLELIEQRLVATLGSREPLLTEIGEYLVTSGGKRVRPLVALTVFRACGGEDIDEIADVAVALELIHSATLLHDDIIDAGDIRRGQASAYRRYGLASSLVAGDFLFSKAFELCARFDAKVIAWAARACIALTEGEVKQTHFRRNPAVRPEDYWMIIDRKTAGIFEQGARTAAHLAGATTLVDGLANCGRSIGMAFQVVDDLLDVAGDERRTGKTIGIDLREGNPSLPIVLALDDPAIASVWTNPEADEREFAAALRKLQSSPVLDEVRAKALAFTATATEELSHLAPSPYRDHLEVLVRELAERAR